MPPKSKQNELYQQFRFPMLWLYVKVCNSLVRSAAPRTVVALLQTHTIFAIGHQAKTDAEVVV